MTNSSSVGEIIMECPVAAIKILLPDFPGFARNDRGPLTADRRKGGPLIPSNPPSLILPFTDTV